ncbi:unnamed protein product, partial [Mesorhabditis belari]|uniref:Dehydrogenase/reductase SDR family member 1 n=1 Tax=Mesorhabditis belari TaxID=2138241 RepID=A0AAF3EP18_9BILA
MVRPLEGQIALALFFNWARLELSSVYITGREPSKSDNIYETSLPALDQTAKDIQDRDGKAVIVYCDHGKDEDVKRLFEQIETETNGRLDILVNNAYSAIKDFRSAGGAAFFDLEPNFWDSVNNVGLRNNYICGVYAAKMMVKRKSGLIVNISSAGGLQYVFNVAYGVGKCAVDRMSADMAVELKPHNIACVTLWPGTVKTEMAQIMQKNDEIGQVLKIDKELADKQVEGAESVEFSGKAIVALASDSKLMKKTGKILLTYDIAKEYKFKDIDGKMPGDMRQMKTALEFLGWKRLASWTPGCLRVPLIGLHMASYKFL